VDDTPSNRPGLVIFDCDGVLVDSEAISNRELAKAISALGYPLTSAESAEAFTGKRLSEVNAQVEEWLREPPPERWIVDFERRRADAFRREVCAVPGVGLAVRELKAAGFDVCVASQARIEKTKLTLGLTGLAREFRDDRLFSASMVARGKPAPDLFLHAAQICAHKPDDCVVVEDTLSGVAAAVAAGMRALAYVADGAIEPFRAAGAEPFQDMRRLPDLVAAHG
jgi:HAD superfamily hydrolase (TIGR01509 family)